jgi:nitrogen fixation protein NifQ
LTVLSNVLAWACFGSHHLWQDLGATGRDEVSRLLEVGFPALFASNTRNLKWKRHLFLVLGEQLGREDLRPPRCDDCDNYAACFGGPAPTSMKTWPLTPTN